MKVKISSVHFKADKKLEDFIESKVEKVASLYDGVIGAEIKLKLDKDENNENKMVDIRLEIPGYDLFAQKQAKSFEEGVDLASEALRRQLLKFKDKLKQK